MPLPLSYPGLKCTLENLEAVKRAHIIARSPGLQKIDKLIPLRLNDFYFHRDEMTINTLSIKYNKDKVEFGMNRKKLNRIGLASQEDRMKKFIYSYFCEKSIIHVDRLCWNHSFLPEDIDVKIRVNLLLASSYRFDTLLPFIDPRSLPLKTVVTVIDSSTFDSQIATSAETLLLARSLNINVTLEELKKLKNKKVIVDRFCYIEIDIIPFIKYHIETKKVAETTFMISTDDRYFLNKMLCGFEQAFGEHRSDLDDVNERFIPGLPKFSIPINNESRIQVYVIEDAGVGGKWKIVIKPVSGVSGH